MKVMLTTTDNPFNPLTEFDDWYAYDEAKGYCTSGYLARVTRTSDELSKEDQDRAIEEAIDEIIQMHPGGNYKKVVSKEK